MWKRRLKAAFLTTVMSLGMVSSSFASISSDLKDAYNGILINTTNPKVVEGQERGYITLGSAYYRTPGSNLQLFTVQPPQIRAGCSGIDFTFGAFSYMSLNQLVQWLQNALQAAPAIAFEIALDKYLPGVKSVLNEIGQMANTINTMNVNSCQAARKLAYTMMGYGPKMSATDQQVSTNQNTEEGNKQDFLASLNSELKDFNKSLQEFFSTPSGKEYKQDVKKACGAYLYRSFEKKYGPDFYKSNSMEKLEYQLLSSLVGEVELSRTSKAKSSPTESQDYHVEYLEPILNLKQLMHVHSGDGSYVYGIGKFENKFEGGTKDIYYGADASSKTRLYDAMKSVCLHYANGDQTQECTDDPGFATITHIMMERVYNKILTHQPLNAKEKDFVGATPIPILKWLNTLAFYPGVSETFIDSSSDWIAAYYVEALLNNALNEVGPLPWKDVNKKQAEDVSKLFARAEEQLKELHDIRAKGSSYFRAYDDLSNFVGHFEKALVTQLGAEHIY